MIALSTLSSISMCHSSWLKKSVFSIQLASLTSSTGFPAGNHTESSSIKSAEEYEKDFKVLNNETAYSGWRKIIRREVLNPNGRSTTYDIVSQGGGSIGVFPWDTETSTTTLVREYHPGVGKFQYGVIGGMFESKKHSSSLECAQFELEEEAHLQSAEWIPLLKSRAKDSSSGSSILISDVNDPPVNGPVSFDKYSDNILYPYIALNCKVVDSPRPLDDDEFIIVEKNVTYKRVWELISTGQMNIFSSYVSMLAMRKLDELGIHIDKTK